MTISNEAVEAAAGAAEQKHESWGSWEDVARAALEAAEGIIRAECLEEAARELAQLPYVRPDHPDRAEYQRMIGIRRGNTDAWLKERAQAERGRQ